MPHGAFAQLTPCEPAIRPPLSYSRSAGSHTSTVTF